MGDTVGWIVDTLLLDEGDATDDPAKRTVQTRKREALECLAYVRDVLKGTVTEVEDDRLLGEEEARRRREKEKSKYLLINRFVAGRILTNSSDVSAQYANISVLRQVSRKLYI